MEINFNEQALSYDELFPVQRKNELLDKIACDCAHICKNFYDYHVKGEGENEGKYATQYGKILCLFLKGITDEAEKMFIIAMLDFLCSTIYDTSKQTDLLNICVQALKL